MVIVTLQIIFLILVSIWYYYHYHLMRKFNFWRNRGVKGPKPIPIFGTIFEVIRGQISLGHYLQNIYNDYKDEKIIGIFDGGAPAVVLRDFDLIRDVLIKDFSTFSDRPVFYHEKKEPLTQNIFSVPTPVWRLLRSKLSQAFTIGKLKNMFNLILECSEQFEGYLETVTKKGDPVDCRQLSSKFVIDVISICAFNLRTNTITDEKSVFCRMGYRIFRNDFSTFLRTRIYQFPWLYQIFGRLLRDKETEKFFLQLTMDMIDHRKKNNICKNDIIDILIDMSYKKKIDNIDITDTLLAAQVFLIFAAGYDTSSLMITNGMYEMALNHIIQNKLRQEINEVLQTTDGKITYECVKQMTYLDTFVQEILRKYPPAMYIVRSSLANYTFRGTDVMIPKKTKVFIPIYGIQHDPDIFSNPEVIDPDRFTKELVKSRHPMTHLPFGDGPRNCLGMRFADYQTKLAIITIVKNCLIDVCEKTPSPPYPTNKQDMMSLQEDCIIYVKLSPISAYRSFDSFSDLKNAGI